MRRLDILKNSLVKKEAQFDEKLDAHFADVKSANGQPLNDKMNGYVTMRRWDRQNDSLNNLQESIEKTKSAIEWEEGAIRVIEMIRNTFPLEIITLLENGTLMQWRKYPHILFVNGVEKARIIRDYKTKKISHKYSKSITDKEQYKKFAQVYNTLNVAINLGNSQNNRKKE